MSDLRETIRELMDLGKIIEVGWVDMMNAYDLQGAREDQLRERRQDVIVLLKEQLARFEGQPEVMRKDNMETLMSTQIESMYREIAILKGLLREAWPFTIKEKGSLYERIQEMLGIK